MADLDWLIARPLAHRGLHDDQNGIIENTPSAFAAAIAARYGIECDLQISSDGEAMVYHDDALGRLTEASGRLDAMTAAELKRVTFKATQDRMMTLGELCDFVAGGAALLIELKSPRAGDRRLATRAAKVLSGYAGQAAVMSFEPAQRLSSWAGSHRGCPAVWPYESTPGATPLPRPGAPWPRSRTCSRRARDSWPIW